MSNLMTIARPYAKAIFEHALATKQLEAWSVLLKNLAEGMLTKEAHQFVSNSATTKEQQTALMLSLCTQIKGSEEQKAVERLLSLLAENKRLLLLPTIYVQYDVLRSLQEKTITVTVNSFAKLTHTDEQQLMLSLSKRLGRNVTLDIRIDESLLGGAVIQAGDLVIDGSVRGKLNKLGTNLAA